MKLFNKSNKKGQLSGLMGKLIVMVLIFAALPALWLIIDSATNTTEFAAIPLIGSFVSVIGIIFGYRALKSSGVIGGR